MLEVKVILKVQYERSLEKETLEVDV